MYPNGNDGIVNIYKYIIVSNKFLHELENLRLEYQGVVMTDEDFLAFMRIRTEKEMIEYSDHYLNGEFIFSTVIHEISFLYNLALFFTECYSINIDSKEYINYVFRQEDKYYYPIFYYLKAIKLYENNKVAIRQHPEFIFEIMRRCYVNLGNEFSNQFRTISALPYFRKAIQLDQHFDMAIGNYAMCIEHHSPLIGYNRPDKLFNLLLELYSQIDINNLENGDQFFEAKQTGYIMQKIRYLRILKEGGNPQYDPLGYFEEIYEEDTYENWCIVNTLSLNYINDIGNYIEASFDINTSDLSQELQLSEICLTLLNNMNKVFKHNRKKLYDCQDVANCTNQLELINIFNALYSFFDIAAFFLYKFFNLVGDEKIISIHSIWKLADVDGFRLLDYKNQYLYDIYWLRKEYKESPLDFFKVNELFSPDAHEYADLRNIFEHRGSFSFNKVAGLKYIDPRDLYLKTVKLAAISRNMILSLIQMVRVERKLIDPATGARNLDLVYFESDGFVDLNRGL